MIYPTLTRVRCVGVWVVVATLLTMPVCGVAQSATALDCLPPIPPAPVNDAATRAEYRTEIGQEFTPYFDEAQSYLRYLDAARAEVSTVRGDAGGPWQSCASGGDLAMIVASATLEAANGPCSVGRHRQRGSARHIGRILEFVAKPDTNR